MHADVEAIGTSYDQILYLYPQLEEDSARATWAYVEEWAGNGSGQGQEFLAYLATIYNNPNKKAHALQALHTTAEGQ